MLLPQTEKLHARPAPKPARAAGTQGFRIVMAEMAVRLATSQRVRCVAGQQDKQYRS